MIDVDVVGLPGGLDDVPDAASVRELCAAGAARAGMREGHLAVEFVDAARIAALNAEHRGEPHATDVLSFPIDGASDHPQQPELELGDVVICLEHTSDVRAAIVHGVLHLAGMDHETDDGEMLALQREVLAAMDHRREGN
jgi:probable rRNA maturation factor